MKKLLIFISFIFLFSNCSILKEKQKEKTDTAIENDITASGQKVTEESVKGGKIESDIIPENQREKDKNGLFKEFLQTYLDGGLTKTILYKPDGSVHVTCEQEEMYRKIIESYILRDQTKIDQNKVAKESVKEEKIQPIIILYFLAGIALILFVFMFFTYKAISKNTVLIDKFLTTKL